MGQPLPLRSDYDARTLRALARRSKDGAQSRRLLTLAAVYESASRTEAARMGGVTLQIVRDWVVRFNAEGPSGLIDRKAPGQPARLTDARRIVHLLRHSLDFVSWKDRKPVAAALKEIYQATDPTGRGCPGGVRGWDLGPEIRCHGPKLAACLG